MPKSTIRKLCSTAPAALLAISAGPLWAGTFDDAPVLGVFGDGLVYVDTKEGVIEPGLHSITTTAGADFPNTVNPSDIDNCLMASNPANDCLAPSGSGKRIKTWLTGSGGMEISLGTAASSNITEYFYYGKTSNFSGARISGLTLQFGTGTGDAFVPMDTSDPALAAIFDEDYINKFNLPDGLFGSGGQEGAGIGFFDDEKMLMSIDLTNPATLDAADPDNDTYLALFGDSILDNSMLPDAMVWDATGTPLESEEAILIGWYNISQEQWYYGNLGVDATTELDDKLQEIADSLGVSVAELDYEGGDPIPDAILALMESNDLYEEAPIEDLRNMNMNYIIDLGDVDGNQVTLRIVPTFADIVEAAETEQQFALAGHLDAAANVPFMDAGNADAYQTAIDDMLAMDDTARAEALESTGFSFLPAFSSLGFEMARGQVDFLTSLSGSAAGSDDSISSQGATSSWELGNDVYWLFDVDGARSTYDTTASSIGYEANITSFSVGAEKRTVDGQAFGVVFGGIQGTAEANNDRGEIDSNGMSLAAFARTGLGEAGSVHGVIGYQQQSFDTTRNVMGETATGATDGSQVFAAVSAEFMFNSGGFSFGPMASLEYYNQSIDGFEESGAGEWNLSVGDHSAETFIKSIGIRAETDLPLSDGSAKLKGSVAYTAADGDDIEYSSGFVGLPGATGSFDGLDEDWVDVFVGFENQWSGNGSTVSSVNGGYYGSFGDNYESHRLQMALAVAF